MSEIFEHHMHILDATDISVGRLASKIAVLLRGKNKVSFVPYLDQGDAVMVENIDKIKVTGNKMNNKSYYHHSMHPGGLKEAKMKELVANKGMTEILRRAVWGMLPKNKLRDGMMKRLTIK